MRPHGPHAAGQFAGCLVPLTRTPAAQRFRFGLRGPGGSTCSRSLRAPPAPEPWWQGTLWSKSRRNSMGQFGQNVGRGRSHHQRLRPFASPMCSMPFCSAGFARATGGFIPKARIIPVPVSEANVRGCKPARSLGHDMHSSRWAAAARWLDRLVCGIPAETPTVTLMD